MPKKPKTPSGVAAARDPLGRLFERVVASGKGDPETSYTARLMQRGRAKIAQKLGEEAVEAVIELMRDDHRAIVAESADVIYHLLVAWSAAGVRPEDVWAELARREGISGLDEKASRKTP